MNKHKLLSYNKNDEIMLPKQFKLIFVIISIILSGCKADQVFLMPTQEKVQTPFQKTLTPTLQGSEIELPLKPVTVQAICLYQICRPLECEEIQGRNYVEGLVHDIGFQVNEYSDKCELGLVIDTNGKAVGADYEHTYDEGSSFCYTGAEIDYKFILYRGEVEIDRYEAQLKEPPFSGTINDCPKKGEAPFERVWYRPLFEGLHYFFGGEILIQGMRNTNNYYKTHDGAYAVLQRLGPEIFPVLLNYQNDEDHTVRTYVVETLERLRMNYPDEIQEFLNDKREE